MALTSIQTELKNEAIRRGLNKYNLVLIVSAYYIRSAGQFNTTKVSGPKQLILDARVILLGYIALENLLVTTKTGP